MSIIVRDAVKEQIRRQDMMADDRPFAHMAQHSAAAIEAWHNREPQPGGITLPNRYADYFAMGFDAAMKGKVAQ